MKSERFETAAVLLAFSLLPLHGYLSWSNLINGIDKGYGHTYPPHSYLLIAAYFIVIFALNAFMLINGRFGPARTLGRYWLICCFFLLLVYGNEIFFPDVMELGLLLLFPPYLVLIPILELLPLRPMSGYFVAVFLFCGINLLICRKCSKTDDG